jgi:mevalonate kinase
MGHGFGKLILFGEYAVLHGQPALVFACNHQVNAHYEIIPEIIPNQSVDYIIRALPLGEALYKDTQQISGPILDFAWKVLQILQAPFGLYTIDSRCFSLQDHAGDWHKMGLGSSAAATVALIRLLYKIKGLEVSNTLLYKLTQAIHHQVQGGLGSGADVASSTFGGLLYYQWHTTKHDIFTNPCGFNDSNFYHSVINNNCHMINVNPLSIVSEDLLNSNTVSDHTTDHTADHTSLGKAKIQQIKHKSLNSLSILCVWTGQSASTTALLAKVQSWAHLSIDTYQQICVDIADCTQQGIKALLNQDRKTLCHIVHYAGQLIATLGEYAGVHLWTDAHTEIQKLIKTQSAVLKPLGAGGGDLAWIVAESRTQEDIVQLKLQQRGWYCMRVALAK